MAYQALYRKWRPLQFDEVVGQEAIIQTLKNQVKAHRTSHAYLFTGTRGTGKTSTAKIFARAMNCSQPVEGSPCNQCSACRHMLSEQNLNVIEMDAASNNGVDTIREIREEVKYTPTEGRYRVYIIDEAHMLSSGAFNALLKTLEEPPPHVKFILATTEPHKIPITILSRCQRYDFKRLKQQVMIQTLTEYLAEEATSVAPKALRYITRLADGSMRDALSLLDRTMAFHLGQTIDLAQVLEVLGGVDTDYYHQLTKALLKQETSSVLTLVDELTMAGKNLSQFLIGQMAFWRDLLLFKSVNQAEQWLTLSEDEQVVMAELGAEVTAEQLMAYIKEISRLEAMLRHQTDKKILTEIGLLRLMHYQPVTDNLDEKVNQLAMRVKKLEGLLTEQRRTIQLDNTQRVTQPTETVQSEVRLSDEQWRQALPEDIQQIIKEWPTTMAGFSGMLRVTLKKTKPYYFDDRKLTLLCPGSVEKHILSNEDNRMTVERVLGQKYGKQVALALVEEAEYNQQKGSQQASLETIDRVIKQIQQKIDYDDITVE